MKGRKKTYTIFQLASAVVMILALLWLTVSTPFVYAADKLAKQEVQKQTGQCQEEDTNPFSNTTEEKNESGVNNLSEYLHDVHLLERISVTLTKYYKCHLSDTYYAFHPDLHLPPPKA